MIPTEHYGEIKRRTHYEALVAEASLTPVRKAAAITQSAIVTIGRADPEDACILELMLSDTAVTA